MNDLTPNNKADKIENTTDRVNNTTDSIKDWVDQIKRFSDNHIDTANKIAEASDRTKESIIGGAIGLIGSGIICALHSVPTLNTFVIISGTALFGGATVSRVLPESKRDRQRRLKQEINRKQKQLNISTDEAFIKLNEIGKNDSILDEEIIAFQKEYYFDLVNNNQKQSKHLNITEEIERINELNIPEEYKVTLIQNTELKPNYINNFLDAANSEDIVD